MLEVFFEYQFMRSALLAGLLASVVCGMVGVLIVEKKLVMMSGGIAHTSYGGVGLGYLLGFEPILGAFGFSILSALGIGAIKRKGGARSDVIIGIFWSVGMALGILFIALTPGYPPDMSAYLFGNILAVTRADLTLIAGVTAAAAFVILAFFNDWKTYLFDVEFAFICGKKTTLMEYALLVITAMTVVAVIRVVGIILVLALLTAPAASAALITRKLGSRMALSAALGCLYCLAGLGLSYLLNIASGAAIVLVSALGYLAVYAYRAVATRRARHG